ncbi:hypothetical protein RAA17_20245 [Komagataeibacter rhaeticus]|nr:hypothetical protein [Komagataeibacter rhaeticus]
MVADMRWGWVLIVAGCVFYMAASWRALCAGARGAAWPGLWGIGRAGHRAGGAGAAGGRG